MARFLAALLVAALFSAVLTTPPAAALSGEGEAALVGAAVAAEEEPAGSEPTAPAAPIGDVVPVALWTFLAVVGAGLIGGVLYLFKRRIGAFPKNPAWVAPITIMRSADAPDEGAFGEAAADGHGAHH